MEVLVYNKDSLSDSDIHEVVTRIKVIIINNKNQLLLAKCNGIYFLPGGHLECGESFIDCLNREIKEETGISLNLRNAEPFFKIMHYTKNYSDSGLNRISEIYYFYVNTDSDVDMSSINLTQYEKDGGFTIVPVAIGEVREFLTNSVTFDGKGEVIVNEILEALDKFKDYYGNVYDYI